jgi:hypothetical protein
MLMKALDEQRARLEECRAKHGDYVGPAVFEKE